VDAKEMLSEMKTVEEIIDTLKNRDDCVVNAPAGLPAVRDDLSLPADLLEFYELTGGITIGDGSEGSPITILGPAIERLDRTSAGESFESGPFEYWFALADVDDGNYLAIDLHPEHSGKCYDTFHETFPFPGHVDIIASSFTDLLNRQVQQPMEAGHYWLDESFESKGDAFSLYGYAELPPDALPPWLGGASSGSSDTQAATAASVEKEKRIKFYAMGAMFGAGLGAVAGGVAGELGQGILNGAIVGAAIGMVVDFMRR
jgi:antitoxin YokJ